MFKKFFLIYALQKVSFYKLDAFNCKLFYQSKMTVIIDWLEKGRSIKIILYSDDFCYWYCLKYNFMLYQTILQSLSLSFQLENLAVSICQIILLQQNTCAF